MNTKSEYKLYFILTNSILKKKTTVLLLKFKKNNVKIINK